MVPSPKPAWCPVLNLSGVPSQTFLMPCSSPWMGRGKEAKGRRIGGAPGEEGKGEEGEEEEEEEEEG